MVIIIVKQDVVLQSVNAITTAKNYIHPEKLHPFATRFTILELLSRSLTDEYGSQYQITSYYNYVRGVVFGLTDVVLQGLNIKNYILLNPILKNLLDGILLLSQSVSSFFLWKKAKQHHGLPYDPSNIDSNLNQTSGETFGSMAEASPHVVNELE